MAAEMLEWGPTPGKRRKFPPNSKGAKRYHINEQHEGMEVAIVDLTRKSTHAKLFPLDAAKLPDPEYTIVVIPTKERVEEFKELHQRLHNLHQPGGDGLTCESPENWRDLPEWRLPTLQDMDAEDSENRPPLLQQAMSPAQRFMLRHGRAP